MVKVFYTNFNTPLSPNKWQTYLDKLPQKIQQTISRKRRWQDQHASLFGKLLLRHALCHTGYPKDSLNRLQYNKYQRPFIDNSIDFNISHTHQYVICAISRRGQIGIDIESIRPIELSNFRNTMSPKDWTAITTAPNSSHKFYENWTIKESVIKADGRGLSIPLEHIQIEPHKARLYNTDWFINQIQIEPNYVCHLVTSWKNPRIDLEFRSPRFILDG